MKNVFFTLNIIFYHLLSSSSCFSLFGCHCFQCYPHKFTITPLSSYGMNESFFVDLIFHCRVPLFDWLVCKKARKKVFVVILESLLFFQYGHSNIINFRSSMIIYLRYHFDQQKKKSPEKVMMIVFIVLFCQHRFSFVLYHY